MQEIKNKKIWDFKINLSLKEQCKNNMYRKRFSVSNGNDRYILYNKKLYLNFSSNNYLGLARHPKIIKMWKKVADEEGVGSSGSGHINGYSKYHSQLENHLSEWLGFEKAILFTSGFSANQSIINTILIPEDHIVADRLVHASLIESSVKSKAKLFRFHHNDLNSLKNFLKKKCLGNKLVLTEGIFSMDGDKAPLSDILILSHKNNSWVLLDDAHGIGSTGKEGRGSICGIDQIPEILVITFGKALGVSGAAVLCKKSLSEYLLQFSKQLIYSTSLPPAQVAAINSAISLVRKEKGEMLRKKLQSNINYFIKNAKNFNLNLTNSNTAIQPIIIGDNLLTMEISDRLKHDYGIWLTAIRPPTVPKKKSRLRIILTAVHKHKDIDLLLEALININQDVRFNY